MKKFLLLLAKDWKNGDKNYTAGMQIELEDKDVAMGLVLDGTATVVQKAVEAGATDEKAIEKMIEKAMESQADKIVEKTANKIHGIQVKDLSDADPFHGFLPNFNGDRATITKAQAEYAMGQFAKDVYEAGPELAKPSERLMKSRERSRLQIQKAAGTGLTVREDDSAGALVPPEISAVMFGIAGEIAVIDPLCAHMTTGSNRIEFPKPQDYDRSAGLVWGGALAYWKGEDAALTESRPKMEDIGINLHALTCLAYASDQALKFSSQDIGSYLMQTMAVAMTFKREAVFMNGTGAGMPLGILNANCKLQVSKETNQAAATIVLQNIYGMEAKVRVRNPGSVAWVYNRLSSLKALKSLFLATGTGGYPVPLFAGNPLSKNATLDGIPLFHSEQAKAIGTAGDLTLCDWSDYLVVDHRSGMDIAQSIHLKFDYGQVAYRVISYVGGQPLSSKSYTDANSQTSSPVVYLQAR